ncbi:MAG TPA: hypothetical protein VEM40_07725 [Nitrospirota bacterium]|nr:hypothetical protein [Nitrospirota bacterium]
MASNTVNEAAIYNTIDLYERAREPWSLAIPLTSHGAEREAT